jgi:hypothetical protein
MRKFNFILILSISIIFFLLNFQLAEAQNLKDVIKAFKKTEIVTKTSNSGKDFLAAYTDAKTEAEMYFDSSGKKNPKIVNSIKKICLAYDWAVSLWKLKQARTPYIHQDDNLVQSIYKDFPDSKNALKGTIQLDEAINWMYFEAEKELRNLNKRK